MEEQANRPRDNATAELGHVQDNNKPNISRLSAMWQVYRRAFPMYASYTFSFDVFVLIVLLDHIKNSAGQNNVNAAALSSAMMQLTVALGISNLIPIAFLISHKRGQLNTATNQADILEISAGISSSMKHIVAITALTAPVALPLVFSAPILTNLFKQDQTVAALVSQFTKFYAPVVVLIQLRSGFEQIMFGLNHQTPAMIMALSTFLLGSGLAYLLCNGIGPFPEWGYPGIAAGFGADALILTIMNGLYLGLHPDFKNYHFFRDLFNWKRDDWRQIKTIFNIGYPISIAFLVEYGAAALMAFWAGILGTNQLAALNFTAALNFFLLPVIIALGQAVCNEVSAAIGEKMWGNAARFARYGLLGSVVAITGLSIPSAIYPRILTYTLTNIQLNPEVSAYLKYISPLTSATISLYTASYCALQTLRPAGDAHWPTVINIFAIGLGLLAEDLLAFHTNIGIYGLYIGLLMWTLLAATLLADRWIPRTSPIALERNALMQERAAAQPAEQTIPQRTRYLSELANCLPAIMREGVFRICHKNDQERQHLLPEPPRPGLPEQLLPSGDKNTPRNL